MEKKKIVHLIGSSFYGGPEKQILEHMALLNAGAEYEATAVSFIESDRPNEMLDIAGSKGLPHAGIASKGMFDFYRTASRLVHFLRMMKADLLCAHGYKAVVIGAAAAFRAGIPVVGFSRGYTTENLKVAIYEWLERKTLGRMNGVICVSEGQARRLSMMKVKCRNRWVVHNAIHVKDMDERVQATNRKIVFTRFGLDISIPLLVTAGRLSPEKGHKVLVEAAACLKKKGTRIQILFCGDGMCKDALIKTAERLSVGDCCIFAGFRRDMDEIFSAMDLFVLPSFTEGLPNVILESFAHRKTAVATRVGGVPEIIDHGINGILVRPGDPGKMAEEIDILLHNKSLLSKMGDTAYDIVKSRFSFEDQNKKLVSIYNTLLELH